MAKHQNGVCEGSLQKTITFSSSSKNTSRSKTVGVFSLSFGGKNSPLASSDTTANLPTYSLLVGVKLICYESMTAMFNGDHPLAQYSLVGVSPVSDDPTSFRAVTDRGTHLLCSAPTKGCRKVWLSALNAGLEYRLLQESERFNSKHSSRTDAYSADDPDTTTRGVILSPVKPKYPRGVKYKSPVRYCHSCGKVELNKSSESPHYYPAPLPQYGMEERVDLCIRCHTAQGVLEHCDWMEELNAMQQQEQDAMLEARRLVLSKLGRKAKNHRQSTTLAEESKKSDGSTSEDGSSFGGNGNGNGNGSANDDKEIEESDRDATGRLLPKSHTLQLKPLSPDILGLVLESPEGVALQRLSPTLRGLCAQFQQGMIGVLEFVELLEAAIGIRDPAMAELKKEAFRVAGDMGTALKLLYEQCLPPTETSSSGNNSLDSSSSQHRRQSNLGSSDLVSTELLQCILEFFLDLVLEEDELNTLAFFWPQISNIHLQMLPPKDTLSLQKIELLEDFLLTVASKYSIHLAIELVWSHTADLEDALSGSYNGSTTTFCGQRQSAVLRFLCELESLLFDFDTGWGGGSVTAGQFMSPSDHQIELLKSSIGRIQTCRLAAEHERLTRSHRLDKIQKSLGLSSPESPENQAKEAMRVANNADYLSSSLVFTKRLCDIAEKLRFLPVNERRGVLSMELAKLNASGTMGGDPINDIKDNNEGHKRVVRIPVMEGHVFRSKARTPVLLLVETMEESALDKTITDTESVIEETSSTKMVEETIVSKVVVDLADEQSVTDMDIPPKEVMAEAVPVEESRDLEDEVVENFSSNKVVEEVAVAKDVEPDEDSSSQQVETMTKLKENESSMDISRENSTDDKGEVKQNASKEESKDSGELTIQNTNKCEEDANEDEISSILESGEERKVEVSSEVGDLETSEESGSPKIVVGEVDKDKLEGNIELQGGILDQAVVEDDSAPIEDRKVAFEDVVMPELDTVTRSTRLESCQSFDTACSLNTSRHDKVEIPRHALRRFDSPKTKPKIVTPTANRKLVENLMTNVVAKQLHMPNLVSDMNTAVDEKAVVNESHESPASHKPEEQHESDSAMDHKQQQLQRSISPKHFKMKNLGAGSTGQEQCNGLSKTGGTRREVLTAIMTKGLSGSHIIAEQAATGAKRHLQDLERRVAVEALLTGGTDISLGRFRSPGTMDEKREELLSLDIRSLSREDLNDAENKSDNDETMEAIRLLLIQHRVANGSISMNDAAALLAPHPNSRSKKNLTGTIMHNGREFPEIDAGDVDSRLIGCGVLPPPVLQALTLWKGDVISNGELLELVKKDFEFEKQSKIVEQNTDKLNEDAAFWGRFAFGERWAEKRSRIAASSPEAILAGWDLTAIIVKSNDDLRQESFVMQLIELCHEAFQEAELELWLNPYRIISTGRTTGIMSCIRNAMSFDGLKKRPGYGTGGIRGHLQRMTEHAANPGEALQSAQRNFVRSLAAYSLLSYMFLFKDRHNGNIMLDTAGHVIHIDFGFVFGIAPGGSFSLEMSTPFKLTEEMIEVMGGLRSSLFSEFVTLFCCGFLALQSHYDTFATLVEVTSRGSTFPCFDGRDTADIISKMEERFCPDYNNEESVAHALDVIKEAVGSYGTKQYDYFQYLSQGIAR